MFPLHGLPLLDSAFPTGAFAHSFGLETAVREGRVTSGRELANWLKVSVQSGPAWMEGVAAFWTHRWVVSGAAVRHEDIEDLDRRLTVSRLSRESREGSVKIGRRYVRLAAELYPDSGVGLYRSWIDQGRCFGQAAVAHGWLWAGMGGDGESAAGGYLYISVMTGVQAALRLSVVGQTEAQKVIRDLLPEVEAATARIARDPPAIGRMGSAGLLQEVAAMRHETLYSRLFMS
ncbi:MAG: urease accessory protein UreF [Kyrpidia tusciae]|nr:urease accessory protein UreF [Kyrpidia tusciae]MBE3552220.1 urease accessory protein UreF [Kyrpidia tusciae]